MPTEGMNDVDKMISLLEKTLESLQDEYIITRRILTKKQVWFSRKAIVCSIGAFYATILFMLYLDYVSFQGVPFTLNDFLSHFPIKFNLSIAITIGITSLILSASINSVKINQINAELGDIYSEIRTVRNQIIILKLERSSKSYKNLPDTNHSKKS